MAESKRKTILIVDDELDMRIFMKTLFETAGYIPVTAKNGREGLEKAQKSPPDLVVLDVMMPGEGGVKMLKALKTDADMKSIPVIMLSGVEKNAFLHTVRMLNTQTEGGLAGPDTYLEKPPDPDALLEVVARILD